MERRRREPSFHAEDDELPEPHASGPSTDWIKVKNQSATMIRSAES
jgi:hypothetical protein